MNISTLPVFWRRLTIVAFVVRTSTAVIAAFCLVWLIAGVGVAAEVDSTWLGNNGNWNDATKWNPAQIPSNTAADTFNATFNSATGQMTTNIEIEKFNFGGGTITRAGTTSRTLTANKKTTWTSGTLDAGVTLIAAGGLDLGPKGATDPMLNGSLQNKGTAKLSGATLNSNAATRGEVINTGTFNLDPNAKIGDINFYNEKNAKFTKLTGGNGVNPITIGGYFANRGQVELKTGARVEFNGFTQFEGSTLVEGGAVFASPDDLEFRGGQLTGGGVVEAPNVINNGGKLKAALASGVKLEIHSNYNTGDTGDSTSTFDSAVGGPGTDPDYASLVDVTGNALLGGLLNVEVWPGYIPNPSYEYYIMTVEGSLSGYFTNAFDGQRIDTVGGEGSFVVHYGSTGYEHEVVLEDWGPPLVPEPASSWLLLSGLLAAGSMRQRRFTR